MPNAITSSGPGDLFTLRNIGNLVPQGRRDASVEAAISYAVGRLEVSSIVVCGHSGCSAMQALLGECDHHVPGDEYVKSWLGHAEPALAAHRDGDHPLARAAAAEGFGHVDQLSLVNVAVQVETLARHPLVRGLHERGRLKVTGLFYDIPTARVLQVTRPIRRI